MGHRKTSFALGEYYHVYNRGNSRQTIFTNQGEYQRFQQLLFVANGSNPFEFRSIEKDTIFSFEKGNPLVAIGAYCLMPNHFHILFTPVVENGVQEFMKKISTSYSMYFNKKHNRTGVFFEGRFKSEHVNDDRYLKYLFSYIHLNPIKLIQTDWREVGIKDLVKAKKYLDEYKYSSYSAYRGENENNVLLHRSVFPDYFQTKKDFNAELLGWLDYQNPVSGGPSSGNS